MTTTALHPPKGTTELTPPNPSTPINGTVVDGAAVTFTWQGVSQFVSYALQVASDRQFTRDVIDVLAGESTSIALHDALPRTDHPYFWRVRAMTSEGESGWSPYGRFFAGSDAQVDEFRRAEEEGALNRRREAARKHATQKAEQELIPYIERDDTIPSASMSKTIGWSLIASFLLVLAVILLATVI